jgi:TetR/AcrR family transcriptional regulator, lmrAB and yxaGH operons repressor
VPRPPSDSRPKLVAATAKLLQTTGYHATSIKEIARAAEAPIGSLYFLFPDGKDELVIEALNQSARDVTSALTAVLAEAKTSHEVVHTYLGVICWLLTESQYTDGCPIATVALEVAPLNATIADVIAAAFDAWTGVLHDALVRTGVAPDAAQIIAATSLAAVEGALIVARTHRDSATFDLIGAGLSAMVDQLAPRRKRRTQASG